MFYQLFDYIMEETVKETCEHCSEFFQRNENFLQ